MKAPNAGARRGSRLAGMLGRRQAYPVLLPLCLPFRLAVWARGLAYDIGVLRVVRVGVPVVSVGNIKVGGTGKTPFCRWLAAKLASFGLSPAIVSRGYRGRARGPLLVGAAGSALVGAQEAGDEAVMLAKTGAAPVVIGRDRVSAARFALQETKADCLILDDGFQHRRLGRDLDIVLLDGTESVSHLLPAGRLREPLSSLKRAHMVLRTVKSSHPPAPGPDGPPASPAQATSRWGRPAQSRCPRVHLGPDSLVVSEAGQWSQRNLSDLAGRRGLVVSGVAEPASLYRWLGEWELEIDGVIEKPDHHGYAVSDWQMIARAAEKVDFVVTTEKDLVKLERYPFARGKLVALRMGVWVEGEERLLAEILEKVKSASA